MNKKDYEKPTMTVVQLNQHGQLLAGSTEMEGRRDSYGNANSDTDIDEDEIIDGEWVWQ